MEAFYVRNLQMVFCDFFDGLQTIPVAGMRDEASKEEWTKLQQSFTYVKGHRYAEDVIINENMSTLLHKYMSMVNVNIQMYQVIAACPGWAWLLMYIDTEIAKKRAMSSSLVSKGNREDMLAQLKERF